MQGPPLPKKPIASLMLKPCAGFILKKIQYLYFKYKYFCTKTKTKRVLQLLPSYSVVKAVTEICPFQNEGS